ncbi:MAG: N-acetylmuramoyl-L-alanine amidase [Planctomycetota bacterium]
MPHRLVALAVLLITVPASVGCESTGQAGRADTVAAHLADVRVPGWTPAELDAALAYLEDRGAWEDHGRPLAVPKHPAEKYLAGWVIVLDPGHGGRGDVPGYKMGPTGVREAEMNLRVAYLLRKLLEDAGAYVTLTREGEVSEAADDRLEDTHQRRADVANTLDRPDGGVGADLFISLHHNASSRPGANYPSVWFHGEADWAEPSLDAAKYVGHRIGAELRCYEVGLTSVLMSDQQMYPKGFAVLRHARVPAFLTESSFFTDPDEEQRLRDAYYNLREAYAIYTGLVEYAYGGRPTQTLPEVRLVGTELVISTTITESLPEWWGHERQRTLGSTIAVYVQGQRVAAEFDPATKTVVAKEAVWADLAEAGPFELRIHHANLYKHHNWPQRYTVEFDAQGKATVTPTRQPYAGEAEPSTADAAG